MTKRTYRRATPRDAVIVTAMGRRILSEMGSASGLPEALTMVEVGRRLSRDRKRAPMFICREGRQAVGFAALEPDPREEGCAVLGVWVLEPYRRRGIGRQLAMMALQLARSAGYAKVRGTLPSGNEAALSFFSEIGALAQVVGGGMQYELPL